MNIIKFIDTVVDGQDWYNDNLRGKYAYWIHCRYIVPLDEITKEEYVGYETDVEPLLGYTYYILKPTFYYVEMDHAPEHPEEAVEYPKVPDGYNVCPDEKYIIVNGIYYELHVDLAYIEIGKDNLPATKKEQAVLVDIVPEHPTKDDSKIIKTCSPEFNFIDQWVEENEWIINYIDLTETEKANALTEFISYNSFIPDDDLTLAELKRFRNWLAETLLSIKDDWNDDEKHILSYYANGMYDDTLKWLHVFGDKNIQIIDNITSNKCGCVGSSNLASLYADSLTICDPVSLYKRGIKDGMVELFSNLNTWSPLPETFLAEVKKYIDGIIKSNLSLTIEDDSLLLGCDCVNRVTEQEVAINILNRLSKAFEYLSNHELANHKNFILSALNDWSLKLYELMYWD